MPHETTFHPTVSIIVPFRHLRGCLDRLLTLVRAQTLSNIEVILVDDCATSASSEIAYAHAAQDARIRIWKNKSAIGPSASRNVGIRQARGTYLAFPDPHDWMDADFYESLLRTAHENGLPDIVKGCCASTATEHETHPDDHAQDAIEHGLAAQRPLYTLFTTQQWTAIYHKRLFEQHGVDFGNARSSQDNAFLLRACHAASSFALCNSNARYHRDRKHASTAAAYNTACHHPCVDTFAEQVDYLLENIEQGSARTDYLIAQVKVYLCDAARTKNPRFAYEWAFPHLLAEQLRRLPDIDQTAVRSPLVAHVLCDTPRSFRSPAQPFFSIVIPVHNMETTIARALESVVVQAFGSYEIIVVANGCDDNTVTIANEHAARYPQIRVLVLWEANVSQARNAGIEAARGRYITFLDADDFLLSGALETMAHALEKSPCDILFTLQGKGLHIWGDARTYEINPPDMRTFINDYPPVCLPADFPPLRSLPMTSSQCGHAYSTSFLRRNHVVCDPRLSAVEDRIFNRQACARAKTISVLNASLYYYDYAYRRNPPEGVEHLEALARSARVFLHDWRSLDIDSARDALSYAAEILRIIDNAVHTNDDAACLEWHQHYLQSADAQSILQAVKAEPPASRYLKEFEQNRPLLADALSHIDSNRPSR